MRVQAQVPRGREGERVKRGLLVSSLAYETTACAGALVCLYGHVPAEFGGIVHGEPVVWDFLRVGTALSPPLTGLLIQAALTYCAGRIGHVGKVGIVGLTLLGASFTAGQFGEPIVYRALAPATFQPVPAAIVATNLAGSLAMLIFGLIAWRQSAKAHPRLPRWRGASVRREYPPLRRRPLFG